MPDNGLANLAGSLLSHGHHTTIWDFATVSSIGQLYPYCFHDSLERLRQEVGQYFRQQQKIPPALLREYAALLQEIEAFQEQRLQKIAGRIIRHCRQQQIDFIGFKLWTGAGLAGSIAIAASIKKQWPSLPIIAGGPHLDYFQQRTFELTDAFDILVYGEGEKIIVNLADYFVNGDPTLAQIPNLIYRRADGTIQSNPQQSPQDLEQLAPPCYDPEVYPAMHGDDKIHLFLLDESRGCPMTAIFCIHPTKSGRRRLLSPQRFVDNLQYLVKRYHGHGFRLAGSNPPAHLRNQIAAEIIRRRLNVRYTAFAHTRDAQQQNFELLRKSGCLCLAYGIESGSQQILDFSINKRCQVETMQRAVIACGASGIHPIISLIVPAPGDNEQTMAQTFRFCLETRPFAINVFPPFVMPNTTWAKKHDQFNIHYDPDYWRMIMTFRNNPFGPPQLWSTPVPISIDARSFAEVAAISLAFQRRLRESGFMVGALDQLDLISSYTKQTIAAVKNDCHRWILSGAEDRLRQFVATINRNIRRQAETRHAQAGGN